MNRAARAPLPTLYPPHVVDALQAAAQRRDHLEIDRITDELAKAGYCRPRSDHGSFVSVAEQRRGVRA